MKKKILCACLSVLVVAVGLWLVPMSAGALSLTAEWSDAAALQEEDVTLTVALNQTVEVKSGLMTVAYDSNVLEPTDGEWLTDAAIADYDVQAGRGVFVFETATALDGAVLRLDFHVKAEAENGNTTVTCTPELRDAQDEEIACEALDVSLRVGRDISALKMNPITSAYQYVGGGADNSSLSGMAEEGSAVYLYNGTLRTAFRVPATYVTDSADFSTIVLEGVSYPITERGIILGVEGQELTVDSPNKVTSTNFRNKYWKYDEATGTVTYTALVKNVKYKAINTRYIARSYVKLLVEDKEHVVYSDTSVSFTSQGLYDATVASLAAQGKPAPRWFTNPSIDDGVLELD